MLGLSFVVQVAGIDESIISKPNPADLVQAIALLKAQAVATELDYSAIVLGADTVVVLDGEVLGKPDDEADARLMLTRLRGRNHQVYTGIALVNAGTQQTLTDVAKIDVPMRNYTDVEIEAYIATGDPMDKAGAYGIQNRTFQPVVNLTGCFAGVMGLPLCHVARALRRFEVHYNPDLPADCQIAHQYGCSVYNEILYLNKVV